MLSDSELVEILPHGSGINSNWTFEKKVLKKHEFTVAQNCYYGMNEYGMYDSHADFKVYLKFDNDILSCDSITFTGYVPRGRSWFYGLKEYLYELIDDAIYSYYKEKQDA